MALGRDPRIDLLMNRLGETSGAVNSRPDAAVPLAGVWPIVTTPFDDDGRLDLVGLANVAEHILAGGAAGLVYPAIASEFQTLTAEERRLAVEHLLTLVGDRRPVIVGVSSHDDRIQSASLAEHAAACGAIAVMFMPRPAASGNLPTSHDVLADIASAADLPIVLQNAPPPLGPALGIPGMVDLLERIPHIRYVKEETLPCGQRISRLLQNRPLGLAGVFGGAGGRFVLDELARGAVGSMPACEFTAMHVAVYERFRSGDLAGARRLFNVLLPLLNFESVFRTPATKQILYRMGIIGSPRHRDENPSLDEHDRSELFSILEDMGSWADFSDRSERRLTGGD